MKGRKMSEEQKKKIGSANKGHIVSKETRNKISNSNKGKKRSSEIRKKISESHKGLPSSRKGKTLSDMHKKRISLAMVGKPSWNKNKKMINHSGSKHHNWKGGVTPKNKIIRMSLEYKLWRKAVFERDNYTCIWCGARSGKDKKVILNADHIKPFAYFPELRFAIDNGRTLCVDCHKTTDTYAKKLFLV